MNKLLHRIGDTRTQIVSLVVLFIAAYWVPLRSMVVTWRDNEDYSYGFMIPLVSAYLLWENRKNLTEIPVRSAWKSLPVLLLFTLISLYGILGSSGNVSMPSVPILIMLLALFCFGVEAVRRLMLPLGFLVFMVPVPAVIERYLGLHLKALSTRLGGAFIALCNIPVNVSGNIIDLGVTQLQVVDACSGMRYIFPLLALGFLYVHFFERVLWKRAVCVTATIPLGILFNALRIGITGVLTDRFGPGMAQGFFHDLSGWAVFVFAFVMLFALSQVLKIFPPSEPAGRKPEGDPVTSPGRGSTTPAFLVSVAVLVTVAALSLSTSTLPAVTIDGGIQRFPLSIGEWKGRSEIVDPDIIKGSGAEEAFSGYFMNGSGGEISLYLGYRSTAFLSNENFFHSPTACLPSSGWTEREVKRRTIGNVPYFHNLNVTQMVIEKGGARQLVYFWFQTKDEATHDKNINRFHLSLHALRRDNTYDLFMRPITPVGSTERIEDAEARMDGFVRALMPVVFEFLKEKRATP
ncbi:MAG TPA: EpsI family protein [Thermodesulfovibrionales bacterium]|nr:EpsI family protein [Thermodesulfovibrionales bacterium]